MGADTKLYFPFTVTSVVKGGSGTKKFKKKIGFAGLIPNAIFTPSFPFFMWWNSLIFEYTGYVAK